MTHFLQRTAIILLGTSALCAVSTVARAEFPKPNFPIHLSQARAEPLANAPAAPLAVQQRDLDVAAGTAEPRLILAASHHRARKPPATPATYEVRKGDTLEKIAGRLGVGVDELKAANGLKRSAIRPGDVLKNPKAAKPKSRTAAKAAKGRSGAAGFASEAPPESYVVRRGDTLFAIAQRFGVSMADLRAANGLSARAQIHSGQKLKLPGDTAEADAQAADEMARQSQRHDRRGRPLPANDDQGEMVTGRGAAGRVVNVPGKAVSYTVRKGDSLERVARRLDTTVDQLRSDNRLKKGAIQPGQRLKGPSSTAKAYVAASGDTLDLVARRFGVSTAALRAENGLSRRATVRPGQKLRLPDGYRDHGPIKTITRVAPREPQPVYEAPPRITPPPPERAAPEAAAPSIGLPSRPQPYTPSPDRQRPYIPPVIPNGPPAAAPVSAPPATDAQISQMGRGRFVWPLQGSVLSDYGPKSGGQRNDGLNIQAEAGATVRAAAAGDVVYAGDQVPGFGNLVLIKHADGWVTAYGHLSHVDVKMQQKVSQGQQIGQAGSTGGVPEPQLHFEVRYAPSPLERARPIDPKLVLPR
jgi:murein DD-endopeptidase MepM/ murein hydrolase activator NlpD